MDLVRRDRNRKQSGWVSGRWMDGRLKTGVGSLPQLSDLERRGLEPLCEVDVSFWDGHLMLVVVRTQI